MTKRHISNFDPEDGAAWEDGNAAIARRNLIWSTASTHVAFSIWSLWSVVVLFMPESVYGIKAGDKLLLAAVATLIGGCARVPYVRANAKFGGRDWAVFSSLILLIPTVGTLLLLVNPGKPLWMYMVCAALTGLGGGNYAAALANVDAFYPQRLKGIALGLCGGIGNLGVAAIQLVGLVVLATVGNTKPELVCAIYLVLLAVVGVCSALWMDNLDHGRQEVGGIRSILSVPDSWIVSALYCAAFGSFIGFAFAFAQVLHATFEKAGHSPAEAALYAARIAFLGPLLGALSRIYGGRVADRRGGGRVTLVVFLGMIVASAVLVITSTIDDHNSRASTSTIVFYIVAFMVLFFLAGMGNGSVLKMIPSIFEARSRSLDGSEAERRHWARSHSGALIGFSTAVGALGGVAINLILRQAYASFASETPAFWVFLASYCAAAGLTWVMYVRRPPLDRRAQRAAVARDTEKVSA
ncbi:MFS transporter [Mycolicibacter arupensis]|jgi:NNP family nitrate/nitrite transporter-like MFS transporter|uniref:MFS transporter n=1 Tax=Mycolicibacter arupensis TaxID=342002 RepID=A0A0F5MZT9_9MYCO|nr:nitrate/nitrite transporter [Mycolicibacter arupensis]KAA1432543.1 NarK/NasA family nitrate transporter [Mycolicibacter arupensis]KKC00212.1 major facilitator transporter [Mycolicibacter arupensis]MCV7277985.1 NarK/NasA family nitrate transporter [Mycolicibacter arupensis]OQZ99909.1 MFS transporter [Mycolicibacter arupensis]